VGGLGSGWAGPGVEVVRGSGYGDGHVDVV